MSRVLGRRAIIGLLTVTLVVAACSEQSNLDPDASVTVRGTILDVDGSPLADRPVRLGSGISEAEVGLAILSVGVSCTSGNCTGDFFDTATADDGTYRLTLQGSDTQSSFNEANSFLLSSSAAPGDGHPAGAAVSGRFRIQTEDLAMPDLALVDPGLVAAAEGGQVRLQWDPAAAPGPYTISVEEPSPVPVWQETTAEGQLLVDGRVLEDTAGQIVVTGRRQDSVVGSDLDVEWRSPSVAYAGGLGAPPSRGRPCTLIGADGVGQPVPACELTDGNLTDGPVTGAEWVRVELAEPVPAELVVVRGCRDTCALRVIGVGAGAPVDVPAASGEFARIGLDGTPIVAVEVADPDADVREVSVWGPAPAAGALAEVDPTVTAALQETVAGPDASGDGGDDDDVPGAAYIAVALVIATVGAAAGYWLALRRRGKTLPPAAWET